MSEKRRTFHVGTPGATRPIVLRNTGPRIWRGPDDVMFMHFGHTWLGEKGARHRVEKWSAPHTDPHTDRTFTSLQAALNAWWRATQTAPEKKTAAQLDAEIAEALTSKGSR